MFLFLLVAGEKQTRRKLRINAVPLYHMGKELQSCLSRKTERAIPKEREIPDTPANQSFYKSLEDLKNRAQNLKITDRWSLFPTANKLVLKHYVVPYVPAQFEISIDSGLGFSIKYYNWKIPPDHNIYMQYKRSLRNITLSDLLKEIEEYSICPAVVDGQSSEETLYNIMQ